MFLPFRPSRPRRAVGLACAAVAIAATLACGQAFNVARFRGDNTALFTATMQQYQQGHWDNAVAGFERLTLELPARDTLLPVAHYYLGLAHGKRKEHLLAAQAYTRLAESFPDHALADDALYGAARSYHRLWRKPTLDAQYGQTAISTYRLYLAMYPNGEQRGAAETQLARLEQDFATKEYEVGVFYRRRKYFDSALIYFRNVVATYPATPRARDAYLRMIETFRDIRYTEDAREACTAATQRYPGDAEIGALCAATPAAGATRPAPPTAADTARAVPPDTTSPRPPAG